MIRFLTSMGFLYAFVFLVMAVYGLVYYRAFIRNGYQRRIFPWVFLAIAAACISFLFINIHASLSLKTFSNLEHHFIRMDGYIADKEMELGKTDTVNHKGRVYNRFSIKREGERFKIASAYAEEPMFIVQGGVNKLVSPSFPAQNHGITFRQDSLTIKLYAGDANTFSITVNNKICGSAVKKITRGLTAWSLLQEDTLFVNSGLLINDEVVSALKNIFFVNDNFSGKDLGELKFFLAGKLFKKAMKVWYDDKPLTAADIQFSTAIDDNTLLGWGIGFPEKNKNQFYLRTMGADSFKLTCRYPVSYPLSEERNTGNTTEWEPHNVLKFLIADEKEIGKMPVVFSEGFLFPGFDGDSVNKFTPLLLSYTKDGSGKAVDIKPENADNKISGVKILPGKLIVPTKHPGLALEFSIVNTMNWQFTNRTLTSATWKYLIFGSLVFFMCMVFFSAWLKPANKISWVWQVLSSVTLVLFTTRFFLYWRYKTFPPYEGLDLPSVQQLNSFWNFGVIVIAVVLMGILLGKDLLSHLFLLIKRFINRYLRKPFSGTSFHSYENYLKKISKLFFFKRISDKIIFWGAWIIILAGSGAAAFLSGFSPSLCRHLAAALILFYFIFVYISCKYSPLVKASDKSWWSVNTSKLLHIIISNPAKILLSLSLLGLFTLIDIGFAIIFLNFLIFNEAFLLINYSIAGLSAGRNRNTIMFGTLAVVYMLFLVANFVYGPYILRFILEMPQQAYAVAYFVFALIIGTSAGRLLKLPVRRKWVMQGVAVLLLFLIAFFFFPKERIQEKAAMTKYRIDVLSMPTDKAITRAYEGGDNYEPVIRAAQNQWFINTFIDEENNPLVNKSGFQLLPHAPQNRGAKYNAQATDLVTSRFIIAEHGRWPVIFYLLILLLPVLMMAFFYKLYPDFTNRINTGYPSVTTGFSILNYLLITALLVILAATGRYIFFGQDLPFGSILSKQSILFPLLLLISVIFFFSKIPLQQYPNRLKLVPGAIIFVCLMGILFFIKPAYNRNKEFGVAELAQGMEGYISSRLQPIWDEVDTTADTRKLSLREKDGLFTGRLKNLYKAGFFNDAPAFLRRQMEDYFQSGFLKHLDQNRMLYLDMNTGSARLAVNENYFHIEEPPHLQQHWRGAVFGDSADYNITLWNAKDGSVVTKRINGFSDGGIILLNDSFVVIAGKNEGTFNLVNNSANDFTLSSANSEVLFGSKDTVSLSNPVRILLKNNKSENEMILVAQPDAFMRNYYVNGGRFYYYPFGNDFIWARNLAESIAGEYSGSDRRNKNVFLSLNAELTDSLAMRIKKMVSEDTAYKNGTEYAICIADGNGRLWAMPDHIMGFVRPDPNNKAAFNKSLSGENGFISQAELRKKTGNINLLRMNPGPGSTLKPIVFSAIASQLSMDWDAFASEGFTDKQQLFGGEKVAEYDFEKNNGRINNVADYLKYSDNYYHSNLLLLGSYSKQSLQALLLKNFLRQKPEGAFHWPYFSYKGAEYWLNGFENWPGYTAGKASFGSDSSFLSQGLSSNFGIHTYRNGKGYDRFTSVYDSLLFGSSHLKSGFIFPEYALFDQKGTGMNLDRPNEVFLSSFRGHVKGSSQVMVPPVKMLDVFGRLVSQNRNYSITLNPYATAPEMSAFNIDSGITYSKYLLLMKAGVFTGMREALFRGTAGILGAQLRNGSPYYYYAKTGTTGNEELKTKSKLFAIVISEKDIAGPDFSFRKNKFVIIYFTSQNGPPKQNEKFQAEIIRMVEGSAVFKRYMRNDK